MKRVFDDYDYERIYDKQLDLSTGELLEEVVSCLLYTSDADDD